MALTVAQLIIGAFHMARAQFPELNKQWIGVSWKIANNLPASMFPMSVQKAGELDLVIRAMEDLFAQNQKSQTESEPFLEHYLMLLSQTWVASTYEIIRLLHDRDKSFGGDFQQLYEMLTLIRVPLEKHEIASERKLAEPLPMVKHPPMNNETDVYLYSREDAKRSVILPMSVSERGSPMWCAPNIKSQTSIWIERRDLSERLLAIWDNPLLSHS